MTSKHAIKRQRGVAAVEFAILGSVFFLLVLGAMDVARLMFTWNTLDATAHRAARLAAVCPPGDASIASLAGFGGTTSSFIIPDFTAANLQLSYLTENFTDNGTGTDSAYVRARIVGYTFRFLGMPILELVQLASPDFESIVPAESLGFTPPNGRGC